MEKLVFLHVNSFVKEAKTPEARNSALKSVGASYHGIAMLYSKLGHVEEVRKLSLSFLYTLCLLQTLVSYNLVSFLHPGVISTPCFLLKTLVSTFHHGDDFAALFLNYTLVSTLQTGLFFIPWSYFTPCFQLYT